MRVIKTLNLIGRENGQSKSIALMKDFKAVNKFLVILLMVKHLFYNQLCNFQYNNDRFSILASGRFSFHFSALEATFFNTL